MMSYVRLHRSQKSESEIFGSKPGSLVHENRTLLDEPSVSLSYSELDKKTIFDTQHLLLIS